MKRILHLSIIVSNDARAVAAVFKAIAVAACVSRIESIDFSIKSTNDSGILFVRVHADGPPDRLVTLLLGEPAVRAATLLKELPPEGSIL